MTSTARVAPRLPRRMGVGVIRQGDPRAHCTAGIHRYYDEVKCFWCGYVLAVDIEAAMADFRERAARVAEEDLLEQPGLVAAEKRFDGGASERTALRIAARIRELK